MKSIKEQTEKELLVNLALQVNNANYAKTESKVDEYFKKSEACRDEIIKRFERIQSEIERLQSVEKAQEWIPVNEIHNTHSGNRVIIHMANDFIVIATYFMHVGFNGYFRNDNGSLVAYDDVIEYIDIPKFAPPAGETK